MALRGTVVSRITKRSLGRVGEASMPPLARRAACVAPAARYTGYSPAVDRPIRGFMGTRWGGLSVGYVNR